MSSDLPAIQWPQKLEHCLECGELALARVWLPHNDEDGPVWRGDCNQGKEHGPIETILVEPSPRQLR